MNVVTIGQLSRKREYYWRDKVRQAQDALDADPSRLSAAAWLVARAEYEEHVNAGKVLCRERAAKMRLLAADRDYIDALVCLRIWTLKVADRFREVTGSQTL